MAKKYTTEQTIQMATDNLTGDIVALTTKRENALNTFRATANELYDVNTSLQQKVASFEALSQFIAEKRAATEQMIEDNAAVRSRILEIIGE